ncbi:MAG: hypothetical protein ACRED9_04060 [Caulobacteraceae bacterium]
MIDRPEIKGMYEARLDLLAQRFSGWWEAGEGPPDAWLTISGRRVAIEILGVESAVLAKARLRFDKVALRLLAGFRKAALAEDSTGVWAFLSCTAPIRLPARTAQAIEERLRKCLGHAGAKFDLAEMIHGNEVRLRLLEARGASQAVGFIHNTGIDPGSLFDLAQALLGKIEPMTRKGVSATPAGERWLLLAAEGARRPLEACRAVLSQVCLPAELTTVAIGLDGGRLEILANR